MLPALHLLPGGTAAATAAAAAAAYLGRRGQHPTHNPAQNTAQLFQWESRDAQEPDTHVYARGHVHLQVYRCIQLYTTAYRCRPVLPMYMV
jgi:hypothetical protein